MRHFPLFVSVLLLVSVSCTNETENKEPVNDHNAARASISGNWTYRSLLNDPTDTASFDSLEFGEGDMTLLAPPMIPSLANSASVRSEK